jgi:PIN domain nuclease of toxin-antitoxin system
MRLLLDTHILLWWVMADRRLPKTVGEMISSAENDVAVSAASMWEIAIKRALGRIDVELDALVAAIAGDGFSELPVRFEHAVQVESLPRHHDDPFDRLLIAQSIREARGLVTTDRLIAAYARMPGLILVGT